MRWLDLLDGAHALELNDAECSMLADALRIAGEEYERIASHDCDDTPEGGWWKISFEKRAAEVRKLAEEIES